MDQTKLHDRVRRNIEKLITDRALQPGSQLPPESKLASELYVSRTTIRNALQALEQEGKIGRTGGRWAIGPAPRL
jgi:DNA-binding GntR family transcriptional regulator